MDVRSLLVRGMLAGLLAGVFALGFAELVGEPFVDKSIAFEEKLGELRGEHADPNAAPEPELVTRGTQKTAGIATGILVVGAALGGLFSLGFAVAYGRIGRFSARATAMLVAGLGFATLYFVPFLKYPANPPAVGLTDTIGARTVQYFGMIALTIVGGALAIAAGRRLRSVLQTWNAVLAGAGVFVVYTVIAFLVLPVVSEVPAGYPSDVLWGFRLASVGTQVVLWTALGLVFGALTERSVTRTARAAVHA